MFKSRHPFRIIALAFAALMMGWLTSGCSSNGKKVDKELAQERAPKNRAELRETSSHLIDEAVNVTPDQKMRLYALQLKVRNEIDEANEESLKLKSLVVKNLISPDYHETKNRVLKSRIKKLEGKKVNLVLDAVDEANKILGRETARNNRILYDFIEPRAIR